MNTPVERATDKAENLIKSSPAKQECVDTPHQWDEESYFDHTPQPTFEIPALKSKVRMNQSISMARNR
jgi:hypothetical protein